MRRDRRRVTRRRVIDSRRGETIIMFGYVYYVDVDVRTVIQKSADDVRM